MIRLLFVCILSLFSLGVVAQSDSTENRTPTYKPLTYWQRIDSIKQDRLAREKRAADSIKRVQDSLQMQWVKLPDENRPNLFLDSLKELYTVKNGDFFSWANQFKDSKPSRKAGAPKRVRESWVVAVVLGLMLLFGIIRVSYPAEVSIIIQAFFNKRVLSQISKEENLFNSWPFVFLYILFGFTMGLFLYLVNRLTQIGGLVEGFNLYLLFSLSVIVLFTLKIITVRFLGFLFDVSRVVREYVSILYLSYFNTALLFLPLVLVMAFSERSAGIPFIILAIVLLATVFLIQFLRAGTSIFKTYSFSKFYLFLYLCTLEIGPILILIKVLGF